MAEVGVAASIAGLISLAGQLYTALDTFLTNFKDASDLAQVVQSEINSFRNSLNALQHVISDPAFCCTYRGGLISANYIVTSLTDAVLLFSQLEKTVTPLTAFTELTPFAKSKWARSKPKLNELISRLQWQKHTLVLQLNILKWYVYLCKSAPL